MPVERREQKQERTEGEAELWCRSNSIRALEYMCPLEMS